MGLLALARRSWEPLSVLIALVSFLTIVAYGANKFFLQEECDFCPLQLAPLEIKPNPLVIGQPATLVDGLCNRSEKPVSATVALTLEPKASALNPSLQPIELVNSMRNLDAGQCLAQNPVMVESVSDTLPLGTWRLAARITARSSSGQMQIIAQTSSYFDIVRRPY